MKDLLIVDGYNIINAWPELAVLKESSLGHSRDKLVEMLAGFGAFRDFQVLIVFDAHMTAGTNTCEQTYAHVDVVFTNEGETADSYIEKTTYAIVRRGVRVYVATSDGAEQTVVLGAGACRISALELRRDVKEAEKIIQKSHSRSVLNSHRQELAGRLNDNILKRLNELRHKQ